METLMILTYMLLALYLLSAIAAGYLGRRKALAPDGHAIASHRAGYLRATASMFTLLGAGELVVMGALSYSYSYAAMWFFGGVAAGFVGLMYAAPRLRSDEAVKHYTGLPDYVRTRFGKSAGLASSLVVFLAFGCLLMIQYAVGASLLSAMLGWPFPVVVLLMTGVIILYLTVGGFEAVLNTDVLQAIVMIVTAAIVLIATQGLTGLPQAPTPVESMPLLTGLLFFIPAFLAVTTGADLWQIIFSTKSVGTARASLGTAAVAFIGYGVFLSYLGNMARAVAPSINPNDAFVTALTHVLPPSYTIVGVILVFAAVMSTADTEIFLVTRTVVREYKSWFSPDLIAETERRYTIAGLSYAGIAGALIAIATAQGNLAVYYFVVVGLALALAPAMIVSFRFAPSGRSVTISLLSAPACLLVAGLMDQLSEVNAPWIALGAASVTLVATMLVDHFRPANGGA